MIIEPIEIPDIDPTLPPEEQLVKLRIFTTELVQTLNSIFQTIQSQNSFTVELAGSPNQRATGTAQRMARASSDINMGGHRISGVGSPKAPGDVVTLEYFNNSKKGGA